MVIYDCDVCVIEKRYYIGVSVEAESEEEALKKAKNLDWEDYLDTEVVEILEVEDVDFYD